MQWSAAFNQLKHMQKDTHLAVALDDQLEQPVPTATIANEAFKQAIKAGFAEEDIAAVYKIIK